MTINEEAAGGDQSKQNSVRSKLWLKNTECLTNFTSSKNVRCKLLLGCSNQRGFDWIALVDSTPGFAALSSYCEKKKRFKHINKKRESLFLVQKVSDDQFRRSLEAFWHQVVTVNGWNKYRKLCCSIYNKTVHEIYRVCFPNMWTQTSKPPLTPDMKDSFLQFHRNYTFADLYIFFHHAALSAV